MLKFALVGDIITLLKSNPDYVPFLTEMCGTVMVDVTSEQRLQILARFYKALGKTGMLTCTFLRRIMQTFRYSHQPGNVQRDPRCVAAERVRVQPERSTTSSRNAVQAKPGSGLLQPHPLEGSADTPEGPCEGRL